MILLLFQRFKSYLLSLKQKSMFSKHRDDYIALNIERCVYVWCSYECVM